MRIYFPSIDFPKAAAKRLSRASSGTLSECQEALASACGYRDWNELNVTSRSAVERESKPSLQVLCELVCSIANRIQMNAGDVQYALFSLPFATADTLSLEDHLRLRSLVFRRTEIPEPSGRGPGAVVREKKGGRLLIIRSHPSGALLISNRSASTGLATFEYSLPRQRLPLFIPRRLYVPYGVWTEADGAKVLFSRDYIPLWRVRVGRPPERLSPSDWIHYTEQEWFFADGNAPWEEEERYGALLRRLQSYSIRGVPKLVELLPSLVYDRGMRSPRSAAEGFFGGRTSIAA